MQLNRKMVMQGCLITLVLNLLEPLGRKVFCVDLQSITPVWLGSSPLGFMLAASPAVGDVPCLER